MTFFHGEAGLQQYMNIVAPVPARAFARLRLGVVFLNGRTKPEARMWNRRFDACIAFFYAIRTSRPQWQRVHVDESNVTKARR